MNTTKETSAKESDAGSGNPQRLEYMDREVRDWLQTWAVRTAYRPLYEHLCREALDCEELPMTFTEVEAILAAPLPELARRLPIWWSNHIEKEGHDQSVAWIAAGWTARDVDLESESLTWRRPPKDRTPTPLLDEMWPPRSLGGWGKTMLLSREDYC